MIAALTDYATRIWEFAFAFFTQFFLLATGIIFLIDQLLSRNFWPKAFLDWLHEHWPEEGRHRTFRRLVIVGLAISAFLAFDRVNEDLKKQTAQLNQQKDPTQGKPVENRASMSFEMERAGWKHNVLNRYNVVRYPLAYSLSNGKWALILFYDKQFIPIRADVKIDNREIKAGWEAQYFYPEAAIFLFDGELIKDGITVEISLHGSE
ncbi:hypothetical protein ABIB94_009256 [Bradyrhizobium sp. JR7.2]|jgi:hypothetical protein|uniref:hypothetical protein n=1 Tax=Bradyrhizobium TaxID=374 RepID=UPI0024AEFBC2|nr:hypothetical protein [Bradyrhizobium barranii]WFT91172.1 hypothetical protein QA633_22570 [Bradyrhizobium barranii]